MEEEKIKQSFNRAKQDITELKEQLALITQELELLRNHIINIQDSQNTQPYNPLFQPTNQQTNNQAYLSAQNPQNPSIQQENNTNQHKNSTLQHITPPFPADILPLYALKSPNKEVSIGNEGVPADRQTIKQTNQHTGNEGVSPLKELPEILETLDAIKEEVRIKFKHLTKQEMQVFVTLYSLEEKGFIVDYPFLAKSLSLTESSIRDYIQRLIKKNLPLIKSKENNKKVFISISPEFKKIISLSTILKIKEF